MAKVGKRYTRAKKPGPRPPTNSPVQTRNTLRQGRYNFGPGGVVRKRASGGSAKIGRAVTLTKKLFRPDAKLDASQVRDLRKPVRKIGKRLSRK